jgi:hypothetical protein
LFTSSATVQFDQNSQQYHLYKANAGLERDELNLRVVGIVTDLALPPVARINYRCVLNINMLSMKVNI